MILETNGLWSLLKTEIINGKIPENARKENKKNLVLTPDIFQTCPYLDYIYQGQTILFVLILGSTSRGLTDEWSDCDLIVFTERDYKPKEKYTLDYDGLHIHWYYKSIKSLVSNAINYGSFLDKLNLFSYHFVDDRALLYLNPKYKDTWNTFKSNFKLLAEIGISLVASQVISFIRAYQTVLKENFANLPLKFYHHFIEILYYLKNEPRDLAYLKRVKRMRYISLSEEDFKRLFLDLEACKQLLSERDTAIDNLVEDWNSLWMDVNDDQV